LGAHKGAQPAPAGHPHTGRRGPPGPGEAPSRGGAPPPGASPGGVGVGWRRLGRALGAWGPWGALRLMPDMGGVPSAWRLGPPPGCALLGAGIVVV